MFMDNLTAFAMIIPAVIIMTIFCYIPLVNSVSKCFTDWTFYKAPNYVGLRNFKQALTSTSYMRSMTNIVYFVCTVIPLQVVLGFLFAHVIMRLTPRFGSTVKTAIYVPSVISGIIASIMFAGLFNYKGGLINYCLIKLGVGRVAFFTEPTLARWTIIITNIWLGVGNTTLLLLAGLMNVPANYYEAASIDGANALEKMIYITLPSMKNIFVLLIVQMMAGTLQMYDVPMQLTGGGPFEMTNTPMLYIMNTFRSSTDTMGYTIACSLLMMVIVVILNSIVFRLIKSEKSMDE